MSEKNLSAGAELYNAEQGENMARDAEYGSDRKDDVTFAAGPASAAGEPSFSSALTEENAPYFEASGPVQDAPNASFQYSAQDYQQIAQPYSQNAVSYAFDTPYAQKLSWQNSYQQGCFDQPATPYVSNNFSIGASSDSESKPKSSPFASLRSIKTLKDLFKNKLISNALLFVLSIVMFFGALFAPIGHSTVKISSTQEVDISFSGVESVQLFFTSFNVMSDAQIAKTELYKETVALADTINFSSSKFSSSKLDAIGTLLKNGIYLNVASSGSDFRPAIVFSAFVTIAFVIVAAIFLYKSAGAFFSALFDNGDFDGSSESKDRSAVHLLWYLLAMIPLLSYSFVQLCNWGESVDFAIYSTGGSGSSWGVGLLATLALLVSAYLVVSSVVLGEGRVVEESRGERIKRIVFLGFVFLLIISLFLPAFGVTAKKGRKKSEYFGLSLSELGIPGSSTVDNYDALSSWEWEEAIITSAESAFVKNSTFSESSVFNALVFGVGEYDVRGLYIATQLVTYTVFVLLIFLFVRSIKIVAYGEKYTSGTAGFKNCVCSFLIVNSVFEVVLLMMARLSSFSNLGSYISVGFGFGLILSLICVIGLFTVGPMLTRMHSHKETAYHAADVSYAPYVVR